jgi:hypothetical protein
MLIYALLPPTALTALLLINCIGINEAGCPISNRILVSRSASLNLPSLVVDVNPIYWFGIDVADASCSSLTNKYMVRFLSKNDLGTGK